MEDFNFLGVIINENLSWKSHCDKIANSISKSIGIINRLKHSLPREILTMLYNSMILSHINYCILAWGYEHSRLFKLQKKSIRIISNSKYNAHTEPLFKRLKLLKIEHILKVNEIKFYYKYENLKLPDYFQKTSTRTTHNMNPEKNAHFSLNLNSAIHQHNTRSRENIHILRTNHKFANKCLRYNLPHTVNNTPKQIIDKIKTHSMQTVVNNLKEHYIENYQVNCDMVYCYICNR